MLAIFNWNLKEYDWYNLVQYMILVRVTYHMYRIVLTDQLQSTKRKYKTDIELIK